MTERHVRVGVLESGAVDTELSSHDNETIRGDLAASAVDERPGQA